MIRWTSNTTSVPNGRFDGCLTPQEVADRLGISRKTTYELMRDGELRSIRIGRRCIRVQESMLDEFLRDREITRQESPQALEAAEAIHEARRGVDSLPPHDTEGR